MSYTDKQLLEIYYIFKDFDDWQVRAYRDYSELVKYRKIFNYLFNNVSLFPYNHPDFYYEKYSSTPNYTNFVNPDDVESLSCSFIRDILSILNNIEEEKIPYIDEDMLYTMCGVLPRTETIDAMMASILTPSIYSASNLYQYIENANEFFDEPYFELERVEYNNINKIAEKKEEILLSSYDEERTNNCSIVNGLYCSFLNMICVYFYANQDTYNNDISILNKLLNNFKTCSTYYLDNYNQRDNKKFDIQGNEMIDNYDIYQFVDGIANELLDDNKIKKLIK